MLVSSTPDRILDTAERLFAEQGIESVSLRTIISEADVNIAAVHYHFGSKDELICEVIRRRLRSINKARLERLEELQQQLEGKPIPVPELLRALFAPVMEVGRDKKSGGQKFFQVVARAHAGTNELVQQALYSELRPVIEAFSKEMARAAPELSPRERSMRLALSAGAMVQAVMLPLKPVFTEALFGGDVSADEILEMLISFCSGAISGEGSV